MAIVLRLRNLHVEGEKSRSDNEKHVDLLICNSFLFCTIGTPLIFSAISMVFAAPHSGIRGGWEMQQNGFHGTSALGPSPATSWCWALSNWLCFCSHFRFWLAVQDLKKQPLQDVAKRVEEIWQEFLAPGAPSAINLDSHSYEITSQNVKDGGRYTFEDAQVCLSTQVVVIRCSFVHFIAWPINTSSRHCG